MDYVYRDRYSTIQHNERSYVHPSFTRVLMTAPHIVRYQQLKPFPMTQVQNKHITLPMPCLLPVLVIKLMCFIASTKPTTRHLF